MVNMALVLYYSYIVSVNAGVVWKVIVMLYNVSGNLLFILMYIIGGNIVYIYYVYMYDIYF